MIRIIFRCLVPFVILGCGVGAMFALGSRQQETRPPDEEQTAPEVDTMAVLPFEGQLDIRVDGIVAPFREIDVAAEVAGRITFKAEVCRAGRFVSQGTPLIEIDPRDYELELQRSNKQLEQAHAELEELDVEISNLDSLIELAIDDKELQAKELQRLENLSGSISQSEIDRARRAVVISENARQTLENQQRSARVGRGRLLIAIELAQAQVRDTALDLERSKIIAPVDGVIVQDTVEEGSYVQRGTALFALEDTSSIEVRCNLRMEDLYWLWQQKDSPTESLESLVQMAYQVPRAAATVTYEFAGREDLRFSWAGRLARFDGIGLDERTRTVPCRVAVDDPRKAQWIGKSEDALSMSKAGPPALVRGMFVSVTLHARPDAEFVRVPEAAVQPGKRVWLVREGRLLEKGPLPLVRGVQVVRQDGRIHRFVLTPARESGLAAGDRLVITPLTGSVDGMPVTVATDQPIGEALP